MPLHGKVVVIKRSGVDGTEFPLTAACVFGRKAECDIRIQLPQVSKEHCKIDLNENKEVIVTNLSSVNPTRINGEVLQQSERLKHGDLITIFDRSFRFEYPPAPTPKKRSSIGGKTETLRVLQDKQARDTTAAETVDKTSEAPSYPCLKDGTNNDNIQRTPEKTVEVESTDSPFGDLYQMIKKTLDSKSPWKPSGSQPQTPATRFCTPQPVSVRKAAGEVAILPKAEECTLREVKAEESSGITAVEGDAEVENVVVATPKSVKKEQNSFQCGLAVEEKPLTEQAANPATPVQETPKHKRRSLTSKTPTATVATSSPLKKHQATPQKFTVTQMGQRVSVETTLTPTRRKGKEATPIKPAVTEVQDQTEALPSTPKTNPSPRHSPRTAEKKLQAQEATPIKPAVTEVQDQTEALPSTPMTNPSPRHSPRTAEKKRQAQEKQQAQEVAQVIEAAATVNVTAAKKRKSEELGADLPMPRMKRKRVSFGGPLNPELFDKRMPPDSPLRKGAAPRHSLCVPKLTTSLLRRASVGGFPKAKTPSPAKKSPKAKTPSPAKKSPKAKTPSPAKKSPKAKTPSSAKKSPKVKTPSPQTPTVQGRFSVSHISTPSPVAEEAISAPEPSATMTPKMPLRRKSMKSTSRKTLTKEVMRRRSGVSRASLKVVNSWADIVKFGQKKSQVVAQEAKKASAQMKKKAAMPKPKTPVKNVKNSASTGHADSPVSIVVGRAHNRVQPTGAAPRLVHNIVLLKNMKMDEDLTGIEEIFSTPVGVKQRKSSFVSVPLSTTKTPVSTSVIEASSSVVSVPPSASKTPVSTSVSEASVMNTPEETGEMIVSPLAVASSAKSGKYNHEAVERLFLADDTSSFVSEEEVPIDEVSEQQCPDLETEMTTTPQQKPPQPDCLTGVKRLLKTPRQKPEPLEDLRGKLLKTPKQKAEQVECLTGVKRIMKTPRQKAEPVEDIRGRLLMTPKPEKPEQPECLSGVKRMMKTPRQKAESVAPMVMEEVSVNGVGELLETPIHKEPLKDLIDMTDATPEVKSSLLDSTSDTVEGMVNVESLMKTPKEKVKPVDGLMKTPKQMEEPIEESCSPKSLMKTPRLSGNPPVEDLEEPQELTEEPLTNVCVEMATVEGHDEMQPQNESDKPQQEPEVETIVPVSGDDAEVMQEIPVEAENNTSLPADDDQQASEQPTATVETDESQEAEVETIVSEDDAEVMQEIPVEAENNASLPADDDQQASEQPTATVAVETDESQGHEEAVVIPAEKPRRGGRKIKQDTKSESTEAQDIQLTVATEKPKRGGRAKTRAVVKEVEIMLEAKPEPAMDDVPKAKQDLPEAETRESPLNNSEPEVQTIVPVSGDVAEVVQEIPVEAESNTSLPADDQQLGDAQSSTAIEEKEMPVLKTRGRGRKSKQDLAETQEAHNEAVPAEKPKRGGRKIKPETKSEVPHESTEVLDKPLTIATETPKKRSTKKEETLLTEVEIISEEPEEEPATTSTAIKKIEMPVLKTRGRGRKAKQDLPEAVENEEAHEEAVDIPHEEAVVIPAEKPRRGGRKAKQDLPEDVEIEEAHEEAVVIPHEEAVVIPHEEAVVIPHEEAVDIPAEKPRRGGRKAKQDLPEAVVIPHEEAIPAEKPKRGGRKTKQDTQSVVPAESAEAQDLQLTIATPKLGARAKTGTVVKEVEIMVEAEPAKDDVPEEKLDDDQSSTAIEESEMPVLKPRGRGRKAKQDLPEAQTQEAHEEAVPAEKPKRGRKKGTTIKETLVKEVEIISEETEEKPEHTQEDVQEENTGDVQTATAIKKSEMPVLKTRGRGRKAQQDLPEAVEETKEAHEEAVIPAEKPKRGGRKIKSVVPTDLTEVQDKPLTIKEVEIVSEKPEERPEPTQDDVQEEKSDDAPVVKSRKGRKVNSAVKDDDSQATPAKRSRRGEAPPSPQEAAVVETTVPVTKTAARGRGKAKSESKTQDADSKTKVSAGPVRKGRKASPPADDTVVVPSTEEVMEEVEDEQQNPQAKKSVVWKDDLTVTHVISPAVRAVRGRKAKLADDVASPRPSPAKRDQSVESVECPASEATASPKPGSKRKAPRNVRKAEEEDHSETTVPSEPIKRGRRVKATDTALVETVTPATEVPETKPRRGRAKK